MSNCVEKTFPHAELLKEDDIEQQYMISFDRDRFWLAVPRARELKDLHFVCVFSGRGGTGSQNNISGDEIAKGFRHRMAAAGFAFICAECSPDAWGDPESTRATLAAIEYCRRQGINIPEKIDLLGFSMGGLGALMFAARHPEKVRKVIDVFGVTDLTEHCRNRTRQDALSELPDSEKRERSPRAKVELYKNMDILIIHGDEDAIVDIAHSQRMYDLLKKQNSPCRFEIIPGYGHTNRILEKIGPIIQDFLQ